MEAALTSLCSGISDNGVIHLSLHAQYTGADQAEHPVVLQAWTEYDVWHCAS